MPSSRVKERLIRSGEWESWRAAALYASWCSLGTSSTVERDARDGS